VARKRDLTNKLTSDTERPGWRQAINPTVSQRYEPEPVQPVQQTPKRSRSSIRRKTYLLNDELITRIEALAERERVGINELVRHLLSESVAMVESREWELQTKPDKRRIID
jgi:hypothetical protein